MSRLWMGRILLFRSWEDEEELEVNDTGVFGS